MLNSYDALLLRLSYGLLSSRKFDNYLRECHELYRQIWAESEKVIPVPKWAGIQDSHDENWQAKAEAHNQLLAARAEVVKAEVVRRLSRLNTLDDAAFRKAHVVLNMAVQEYWRDNARHRWQAIQDQGRGKIELGYLRRSEALIELSRASTESNVIYIDDTHHFIMFRTPGGAK